VARKNGWEDSTNGPDWIDIRAMMTALRVLHSGEVALILSPDGTGSTGGVDVAASMMFDVLPGSSLPASVVAHGIWPCDTHSSIVAHCFSLLYDLDYKISQVYKQEELWK